MKHPRFDEFTFETVTTHGDGTRYVKCNELAGFRLLIHPTDDFEEVVSDALDIFLPLHDSYVANIVPGDWDGQENAS